MRSIPAPDARIRYTVRPAPSLEHPVTESASQSVAVGEFSTAQDASRSANADVDWFIFTTSAVIILGVCVPLAMFPDSGKAFLDAGFRYVTQDLGVLYVLGASFALGVLLWLALGRYGAVRLGPADSRPDFSTPSWIAMLFCGGIGSSVVYWGTIEWAYYFTAPPFGATPSGGEALLWATAYPLFHWGFTGWALYCLPAVAIAYAYHVREAGTLRLSAACAPAHPALGRGLPGRLIDLTFMVGLIGATSTGLGLSVPLISASLNNMFGVAESFGVSLGIIVVISALFATSVYVGLDRGIKRLSNVNVGLAVGLVLLVFITGPTVFIAETGVEAVGHVLQNYLRMSSYTDAQQTTDFVGAWTVFYWAWWLALGPFMGIFITKISRGRTIKELVLCSLGYGSLGCALFFIVLGNYALYVEQNGIVPVLELLDTKGAPHAIVAVLGALPFGGLALPMFVVLCVIFAATSYDSASYTLASAATRDLDPDAHPPGWHRMFWAFFLSILPITLIYLGGLRSLQSAMVIISVPLLVVMVLLAIGLMRGLREQAPTNG
ncbi:MAG: BCCT family transporter [Pseudomonadota bacterium]